MIIIAFNFVARVFLESQVFLVRKWELVVNLIRAELIEKCMCMFQRRGTEVLQMLPP